MRRDLHSTEFATVSCFVLLADDCTHKCQYEFRDNNLVHAHSLNFFVLLLPIFSSSMQGIFLKLLRVLSVFYQTLVSFQSKGFFCARLLVFFFSNKNCAVVLTPYVALAATSPGSQWIACLNVTYCSQFSVAILAIRGPVALQSSVLRPFLNARMTTCKSGGGEGVG